LVFLLANNFIFGQSVKEKLTIVNSVKLASRNFNYQINFKNKLDYFIIPVKIDTILYEYIFDTGGYNTVTSDIMKKHNLPTLLETEVGSSNKIKSKIKISKIPLLQIGGVKFQDVGVFNFDFNESPVINCFTNGGLIGKSLIHQAVWNIDYKNSIIKVSDNILDFPLLNDSKKIKIELDKTLNPFFYVLINGKQEKFLLDFGFGGLISLTERTASALNLKNVLEIEGEGNISANGVVKEKSFIAAIDKISFGGINLKNQIAYYSKSNNLNLIGSELTKYFIVTLNFKDKELVLTPYNDNENNFETFGFSVNISDSKLYINTIFNGLNAQKNGLLINDELISINGILLSNISVCDSYFLVNEILHNAREILLEIKRGEERKELRILKEKPFNK
jgi:predicted aspartyl protease